MNNQEVRTFNWKWLIIPIVIILVILGLYKIIFSYDECEDWNCFNEHLKSCEKTTFIGQSDKMIFEYKILKSDSEGCLVNVKLLQGELNNKDSTKLEEQEMTCTLPKNIVTIPENDISKCHGRLKEGLQDIIITKLHAYIVQNLGQLNLELLNISQI